MKVQSTLASKPTPDQRRGAILSAAAALFAAEGVSGTSMREIGEKVGVNPGAIYHYYTSKRALVSEVITGYLSDLVDDYHERDLDQLGPKARLQAIVEVSLQTGAKRPDETKIYQTEFAYFRGDPAFAAARQLSNDAQTIWLDAIESGKERGVLRSDVPSKVFHRFIRDAVWLTVYWHRADDPYTIDDVARDCLSVFLDGMAVKSDPVE